MGARLFFFSTGCLALPIVLSCANDGPPAQRSPGQATAAPAVCPKTLDRAFGDALLARHARAYGSHADVRALLPLSIVETATVSGKTGTRETNLSALQSRTQLAVGALRSAHGSGERRIWTMEAGTGVVESLAETEAADALFDAWLMTRRHTSPSEIDAAAVACKPLPGGGARVDITFARDELGTPDYAFDLETAALLAVAYRRPDGRIAAMTFEAWSEPDHGVRWPKKRTDHLSGGEAATFELAKVERGLVCSSVDPASGVLIPQTGEDCVGPPPERMTLRWPEPDPQGRVLARVPFVYLGGELVVRATIDGREVAAFLDSGAGVTAVDAATPAGRTFRSATEVGAAAATQKVQLGFGELPRIELGSLVAEHVPAASVPIPALEGFGSQRPEVIFGYGFFANLVVRVDYIHHEIVFARSADGLLAKGKDARRIQVRVLDGKIVASARIDGAEAPVVIDTGSDGGLDLYRRWGAAHGVPGASPVVTMKGRFGAGAAETSATFFRLNKGSLGPIKLDGLLASTSDPPEPGLLAGLVGNAALARCDAVVIDLGMRAITLEGDCERPVPERRVGWRFEKRTDPKQPARPFVVNALWPQGGAEAAGVQLGDRLLEIGGRPASADVATWWPLEEQPAGTKLPVTLSRAGAPVKLVIELRDLGR